MMQALELSDASEAMTLIAVMHTKLFGNNIGSKLFHNSYQCRGDAAFF